MANAFAKPVEGQGYAVKSSPYAIHPDGLYTMMIAYGNGPVSTHMFQRSMREERWPDASLDDEFIHHCWVRWMAEEAEWRAIRLALLFVRPKGCLMPESDQVYPRWYQDCLRAYAEHCSRTLRLPMEAEVDSWLAEWGELEAESHEDAVEAYWAEQRRYFREGV
jgi:hypothetical protein